MDTLEITIPEGKEIDWQESAKQQKIIFKDKCSTYQDIVDKIINQEHFTYIHNVIACEHSTQLQSKVKLANVCHVLNDGWSPKDDEMCYYLCYSIDSDTFYIKKRLHNNNLGIFVFKTEELAAQAIRILGKETILLALHNIW